MSTLQICMAQVIAKRSLQKLWKIGGSRFLSLQRAHHRILPITILDESAARLGKSRSQVALNWLLQHKSVAVIPKASDKQHVRENAGASGWSLSAKDSRAIDSAFQ